MQFFWNAMVAEQGDEPDEVCTANNGSPRRLSTALGFYLMRSSLISLAAILTLTSSIIEALPQGYRYPTRADRTGAWERLEEDVAAPFCAGGDFNGDGFRDEAWILLRESGEGWGVFLFLNQSIGEPDVIELAAITGETSPQNHGLRVVNPGEYDTACGTGYWNCEPGELERLSLVLPALDFFAFEGANSYFWWDPQSKVFVRTWMSD